MDCTSFNFSAPTRIVFGVGVAASAPKELLSLGARRVFVVTGPGGTAASAGLAAILKGLESAGLGWTHFSGARADPTTEMVDEGVVVYRASNCDAILAFGGGSPMDCAKAIGASAAEKRPIREFVGTGVPLRAILPPLFALPTTAGTGSEVTAVTVLTKTEGGVKAKMGTSSPALYPRLALVDPELHVSMPPAITAATGMDALTHAVESYIAASHSPAADIFCLESIRLAGKSLARACTSGGDMEARSNMAMASTFAGIALANSSLGIVHGYAHALGAQAGMAHGLANAIMLPRVLAACAEAAGERLSAVGEALTGKRSMSPKESAAAVAALAAEIGIPASLAAAGVPEAMLTGLLREAKTYKRRAQTPGNFTDAQLEEILFQAWSGSPYV
jgi:alcohol dehydrogenase